MEKNMIKKLLTFMSCLVFLLLSFLNVQNNTGGWNEVLEGRNQVILNTFL